ncbi:MAG: Electron transport complex subunit RnfC [Candidatus Ordinivivax streblomastigis]|uniref:Ion-translocating oxidoreductase complex subunit C n=1 Tax=Candidatus Ordinivivax streblomastigis TaxID=2540710 RepID=A0A5M8P3R6_9BACT|nr:MAG: Electron transport complex subunit RnfC [Candidatus Ordinivivax streblomastigis]
MLKTFRIGGIHPPGNKLSVHRTIEAIPVPQQVVVPLSQHIGAPATVVVAKGDAVKAGSLLAKAGGFVSANIHSPVSGTVVKIDDVVDASGYKRPAVFIAVEGDVWEESIDRDSTLKKNCELSSKEIIDKIAEAGIAGMGGATFPTHVKLSPPAGMKAEVLLINAAECEPYLTSDHQLMMEKGEEILVGISLLMCAIDVNKAAVGIENNKQDAIRHLTELAKEYPNITVVPLKVQYPQGGEKQLIDAVIGKQITSGALPISVGAVVQNIGTAFAVYEAVQKNKPLFERVVTVTGKQLAQPHNVLARIGTPVSALIEFAGGLPDDTGKIISGGPMMGKALVDTSVPVTKGTSGILILSEPESKRKEIRNCIRCSKCLQACPMGLEPNLLATVSEFEDWEKAEQIHITDCLECGCCNYVCPANRPLLDYVRMGKGKVTRIIQSRNN